MSNTEYNQSLDNEHDGLGYKKYSNVLSQAMVSIDTPFTIAIFSEWGKGKTTLLNFIKYDIDKKRGK